MTTSVKLFEGVHDDEVWCVKIVDKVVISCGYKAIRIWELNNGKQLHKLDLPSFCNNFDLNTDETLLAVAHEKGVSIWNFLSLSKIKEIELNAVMDVRFNESGTKLIVGQYNGQVSKIDLA